MSRLSLFVALVVVGLEPGQGVAQLTDLYGDPLPKGAVARLGTVRLRHPGGISAALVTPDGKSLVTQGGGTIRVWDTATGSPGPRYESRSPGCCAGQSTLALSADSKRIYFPDERTVVAQSLSTNGVEILFTGEEETRIHAVDPSPCGALLAIGTNVGVQVLELPRANPRWSRQNGPTPRGDQNDRLLFHGGPYSMAQFAPNGKLLAVNASDHPKVLRLLDPVNGNEIRTIELGERLVRLAFSPDSRHVAITERDNAVRVYETATGRKLHSWTVDLNNPYENYTAAVAISPDGTIVAAGATDNRVHLWEMATGRELTALENRTWYIWALVFSPDGRWLYAAGWDGAIRRWETSNWKEKPVVPDAATGLVAHAPVGSLVAWTADGGAIHFGDPATGKKHRTVPGKPRSFSCLAFNPDGTMLAAANDELSVQLWEVPTGKLLRQWAWPKGKDPHAQVDDMAFTPDGKVLATTCFRMDEVVLWDIATGNRLGQASHEMAQGVVFVPDGRTMVTAGWDRAVRWWSVPDLRQLDSVVLPHLGLFRDNPIADPRFHKIASTSEGHLLATINIGGGITIWDGRNRKVLRSFRAIVGQCQIAFSPNGQWLTTGGHDGSLALWEVRTGQQALKLEGHPTRIFNVAFSPDGRRLVTGSADSTALVWNLQGSTEKHQQPDVATLFSTLASADAAAAYKAIWALVAAPKESVPFLAEKLKPAAAVDEKRIADFIAALDSDKFAEREKATSELEKLGQIAGPALDKLLKGKPSQEAKRRAEAIVAKLGGPVTSAETLRTLRAIEALEHIGTPEAVQVIEKLAKGAAGARETEDARRTLERLKKRGK